MLIVQKDGTYKLWLCMSCCQAAFYDEWGEYDPEMRTDAYAPLSLLDPADHLMLGGGEEDDAFGPACDGYGTVGMTRYAAWGEVVKPCAVNDGTHHSGDRIEIHSGSTTPTIKCGKHAAS
jgi:hypothetical protein